MQALDKWLRLGVPGGWADVIVRAAKVVVIAFLALQFKEWLDTRELDIPGCAIDAAWVAGASFAMNAILLLATASPGRRGRRRNTSEDKAMRVALTLVFLSCALAAPGAAQEPATKETKETLKSLPPQVREAVLAQSRGATLRGVAKETQNGATLYEVETIVQGRTRDVMLDAQGKVVSVEEQTTLGEIPDKARAAILKAVGTGKLVLVEKVTKGETTFYEGHIHDGRSRSEVKVDAAGKPVE